MEIQKDKGGNLSLVKLLTYKTWEIEEAQDLIDYLHSNGYSDICLPNVEGVREPTYRRGNLVAQVTIEGYYSSKLQFEFELGVRNSKLERVIDKYLDKLKGRWKV